MSQEANEIPTKKEMVKTILGHLDVLRQEVLVFGDLDDFRALRNNFEAYWNKIQAKLNK